MNKKDIDNIQFMVESVKLSIEAIENIINKYIDKYKRENDMKLFEIWMEGFAITGQRAVAQKLGEAYGATFEDAIKNYMSKNLDHGIQHDDNRGYHIWACKLYDNEKDARKSFG